MHEVIGENELVVLFDTHFDSVSRVVMLKVGDDKQAVQIIEDVMCGLKSAADSFEENGLSFKGWVLKRTLEGVRESLASPFAPNGQIVDDFIRLENPLAWMLRQLHPMDQDLLILRIIERLPDEEVALILGKDIQEVKELNFAAMKRLEQLTR